MTLPHKVVSSSSMWPFDRARTEARPVPAPRDGELELAVHKLTKRVEAIEMEWSEWFDKFRRLYARIAKRQERDEQQEAPQSRQDAPEATIPRIPALGGAHPRRNY